MRVDDLTQQLRARLKTIPGAKRAVNEIRRARQGWGARPVDPRRLRFAPDDLVEGAAVALPPGIVSAAEPAADGRFLRLATVGGSARASRAYGRAIDTMHLDPASIGTARFFEQVQSALAVLDDDAGSFASVTDRANAIVGAVAAGVPVIAAHRGDLDSVLPGEFVESLVEPHPADVTEPHDRDRIAARQRRVAWDHLAPRHRSELGSFGHRRRSVSVTLVSNRPDKVAHWAGLLARQDHTDFEVVAVLHGDGFADDDRATATRLLGDRLTLLSAPSGNNLGDALNMAAEVARGDLVVKWDDDDYYSSRHLRDLAAAYEASGAHIVGKAADFVYLAAIDVTIRRGSLSRETYSPSLSGATLTLGRQDLFEIGGWPSLPRQVDTGLISKVLESGGSSFRTSGFGFMMMRAADLTQHTWDADVGYFLDRATAQRRGLDLGFADIDLDV